MNRQYLPRNMNHHHHHHHHFTASWPVSEYESTVSSKEYESTVYSLLLVVKGTQIFWGLQTIYTAKPSCTYLWVSLTTVIIVIPRCLKKYTQHINTERELNWFVPPKLHTSSRIQWKIIKVQEVIHKNHVDFSILHIDSLTSYQLICVW
jgi:hypothetical protein